MKDYQLWLGTFEGKNNKFVWKKLKEFEIFEDAYDEYKKLVKEQLQYDDEELLKIWKSPRLDIELKKNDKLINWTGIYYRRKSKTEEKEEGTHDSIDELYLGPIPHN